MNATTHPHLFNIAPLPGFWSSREGFTITLGAFTSVVPVWMRDEIVDAIDDSDLEIGESMTVFVDENHTPGVTRIGDVTFEFTD